MEEVRTPWRSSDRLFLFSLFLPGLFTLLIVPRVRLAESTVAPGPPYLTLPYLTPAFASCVDCRSPLRLVTYPRQRRSV